MICVLVQERKEGLDIGAANMFYATTKTKIYTIMSHFDVLLHSRIKFSENKFPLCGHLLN